MHKRELSWTNGRCRRSELIRAERRKVPSGESGTSEGLRRHTREKMFQVQWHYIDKQPTVSRDLVTRSLPLLTVNPLSQSHTKTHTSVAQRTRETGFTRQFQVLLQYQLWFMQHSCVKQCLSHPTLWHIRCDVQFNVNSDAMHTGIPTPAYGEKKHTWPSDNCW